jgi:two-component system chemotaxis response regulator CheY
MSYTVLIVDDSATTRCLIGRTLRIGGLNVDCIVEASDGSEALAVVRAQRVDLVLTDLNMPGFDGIALTRTLRKDPLTRDIPVVVISADPSPVHARVLADAGVRAFIRKPFTPEMLRNTLDELLGGEVSHD